MQSAKTILLQFDQLAPAWWSDKLNCRLPLLLSFSWVTCSFSSSYWWRICVTKEEVPLLYDSHHSVLTPKWRCSPNHCLVPLARVQGAPNQSGWDFCCGHRKDIHKAHAFGRRDLHSAVCDYMDANVKLIQGSQGAEKTNIPSKVHIEIVSEYVTC